MALNAATMEVSQQLDMSPEKSASEPMLQEALDEFSEIMEEVEEEGFPTPSKIAFKNAKRLLLELYKICPLRYFAYSTPEGEIAISAQTRPGRRITLICDSRGGALCLVTLNKLGEHKLYPNTMQLPDKFIYDALEELTK